MELWTKLNMSFCNFKTDNSDDEDDFIIDDGFSSEEFRTNSSSSSIKWSVDARKQNEEDWLSIEKILYGEESLPKGLKFLKIIDFSNANKVVCSWFRWKDKRRVSRLDESFSAPPVNTQGLIDLSQFVQLYLLPESSGRRFVYRWRIIWRTPQNTLKKFSPLIPHRYSLTVASHLECLITSSMKSLALDEHAKQALQANRGLKISRNFLESLRLVSLEITSKDLKATRNSSTAPRRSLLNRIVWGKSYQRFRSTKSLK